MGNFNDRAMNLTPFFKKNKGAHFYEVVPCEKTTKLR
jgi:hypothetical protein